MNFWTSPLKHGKITLSYVTMLTTLKFSVFFSVVCSMFVVYPLVWFLLLLLLYFLPWFLGIFGTLFKFFEFKGKLLYYWSSLLLAWISLIHSPKLFSWINSAGWRTYLKSGDNFEKYYLIILSLQYLTALWRLNSLYRSW